METCGFIVALAQRMMLLQKVDSSIKVGFGRLLKDVILVVDPHMPYDDGINC